MAELEYRDGFLVEGPVRSAVDEVVISDPWLVTLAEFRSAGGVEAMRGRLFEALEGFCDWFFPDGHEDSSRRVWVRGQFGCTNHLDVEDLDLVVHYDGDRLGAADRWGAPGPDREARPVPRATDHHGPECQTGCLR